MSKPAAPLEDPDYTPQHMILVGPGLAASVPESDDENPVQGECDLCGQVLIITDYDCWHPFDVERACPPEPGPDGWDNGEWYEFYAAGLRCRRPGREHWVPVQNARKRPPPREG